MQVTTCTRNAHYFAKEFVVTKEKQPKCFLLRRKILEIKSYIPVWYLFMTFIFVSSVFLKIYRITYCHVVLSKSFNCFL